MKISPKDRLRMGLQHIMSDFRHDIELELSGVKPDVNVMMTYYDQLEGLFQFEINNAIEEFWNDEELQYAIMRYGEWDDEELRKAKDKAIAKLIK